VEGPPDRVRIATQERPTDRHRRGMASAYCPGKHLNSQEGEGRSPLGVGALSLARARIPQTEEENAHGEVYRAGRACVKLHAGGGGPEREAAGLARGGDERAGADRGAARHPAEPTRVPRGGDAVGVVVGGVGAARRGAGGDGGSREPGPEERGHRREALVGMPSRWRSSSGPARWRRWCTRTGADSGGWDTWHVRTASWCGTRPG